MSVVKAGFIFSAKGGQASYRSHASWLVWPSFIATGGGGWGLQLVPK